VSRLVCSRRIEHNGPQVQSEPPLRLGARIHVRIAARYSSADAIAEERIGGLGRQAKHDGERQDQEDELCQRAAFVGCGCIR
jgi:hypothetical protein